MSLRIIPKHMQGSGAFNGGQILENKPIGFPRDGGHVRPYSNLFYWAKAEAVVDSTIGLHPHQGFEIMSFVLEGSIRHFDTANNVWKPLHKGDMQIIRAGNGIEHSEHMEKGAVIFQIWTDPDLGRTLSKPASYSDYAATDFPMHADNGNRVKTLIGKDSPVTLDTPGITITQYSLAGTLKVDVESDTSESLYVIAGSGSANGQGFEEDTFIIYEGEGSLIIDPHDTVELFRISSPSTPGYPLYTDRLMAQS